MLDMCSHILAESCLAVVAAVSSGNSRVLQIRFGHELVHLTCPQICKSSLNHVGQSHTDQQFHQAPVVVAKIGSAPR